MITSPPIFHFLFCVLTAPTCSDNIQNSQETGIDCGGTCQLKCSNELCTYNSDCKSGICGNKNHCSGKYWLSMRHQLERIWIISAPRCTDGVQNGNETGVDCGTSCPLKCDGEPCLFDSECKNNYCGNQNYQPGICQSELTRTECSF